jgi:hypothetical protein
LLSSDAAFSRLQSPDFQRQKRPKSVLQRVRAALSIFPKGIAEPLKFRHTNELLKIVTAAAAAQAI